MKYTKEFIEYVHKYPFTVKENCCNGVEDEIVFTDKQEAFDYIEREKMKHKRTRFKFIENRLDPEYM